MGFGPACIIIMVMCKVYDDKNNSASVPTNVNYNVLTLLVSSWHVIGHPAWIHGWHCVVKLSHSRVQLSACSRMHDTSITSKLNIKVMTSYGYVGYFQPQYQYHASLEYNNNHNTMVLIALSISASQEDTTSYLLLVSIIFLNLSMGEEGERGSSAFLPLLLLNF